MAVICKIDTNKIKNGTGLFHYSNRSILCEWDSDLSNMTCADHMFNLCTNLHTFKGDLSNLTCNYRMFAESALSSWEIDLPNLVLGGGMFYNCPNLTSFEGDLSKLKSGALGYTGSRQGMFCDSKLNNFRGNLKSLVDGRYMFRRCNLSNDSLACIAGTINDYTKNNDLYYSCIAGTSDCYGYIDEGGIIDIGSISSGSTFYPVVVGLLQEKGWTVKNNDV